MKRREVYLSSAGPELAEAFRRYGVHVRVFAGPMDDLAIGQLLQKSDSETRVLAVLDLVPSSVEPLATILNAYTLVEDRVSIDKYRCEETSSTDSSMQKTVAEMLVGSFIAENLTYRQHTDLNFNPMAMTSTLDFERDPADFIVQNRFLNNSMAQGYGCTNLYRSVLNQGVFFRSAKNRREKNYWCPGLNAGIPLVPKRDEIHELTFMAHDLGHFMIPDLIFSGTHSISNRQTYIVYRMMSEAFTLVLTDMILVDSVAKQGVDYDYSKRKIYPLFERFGLDLSDKDCFSSNLKSLLKAGVTYCLRGCESGFKELMGADFSGKGQTALEDFKYKYMPFFVEDFKWTERNYDFFHSRQNEFAKWWALVEPIRTRVDLGLETIDEFSQLLDPIDGDLIDQVFAILFQRIEQIFSGPKPEILPYSQRLNLAFSRYMMGQLVMFVRYEQAVPEIRQSCRMLLELLGRSPESMQKQTVDLCLSLMRDVIKYLEERRIITADDASTFSSLFPIFEPQYAHYDEDKAFYRDLSEESQRILYEAYA